MRVWDASPDSHPPPQTLTRAHVCEGGADGAPGPAKRRKDCADEVCLGHQHSRLWMAGLALPLLPAPASFAWSSCSVCVCCVCGVCGVRGVRGVWGGWEGRKIGLRNERESAWVGARVRGCVCTRVSAWMAGWVRARDGWMIWGLVCTLTDKGLVVFGLGAPSGPSTGSLLMSASSNVSVLMVSCFAFLAALPF
jgi:hypothetical protein